MRGLSESIASVRWRAVLRVRVVAACAAGAAILGGFGDANPHGSAPDAAVAPANATQSFYATPFARTPSAAELAVLGREMFFDPGLSASGKVSCATCHDPRHAYGPPDEAATPRGGVSGSERGFRAAPSLRYLQNVPAFTLHMHETEGDDSVDQGPAGGHTWDGRAQSLHDQARLPLLSAHEMANADPGAVVAKLRAAPYAQRLGAVFGERVLDDPARSFNAALLALEVFQQEPDEFYPYSSKYDEYLRGRETLSAQEQHGLALFNDPRKGNCASCHPSAVKEGAFPAFTDFGFVALGVPRNRSLPANRDPEFFDLGLCGPERRDLTDRDEYCGMFRTPTLRNVALRRSFFHNGAINTLDHAVDFYAERDVAPGKWYPRNPDGSVRKFDDLPIAYSRNVNADPPFDRRPGDRPALSRVERADIVAFLRTLTDGQRRAMPTAH